MTREDIMRMAEEAEILDANWQVDQLERFAQLVAAAEREACAKLCEDFDVGVLVLVPITRGQHILANAIRARGQQ